MKSAGTGLSDLCHVGSYVGTGGINHPSGIWGSGYWCGALLSCYGGTNWALSVGSPFLCAFYSFSEIVLEATWSGYVTHETSVFSKCGKTLVVPLPCINWGWSLEAQKWLFLCSAVVEEYWPHSPYLFSEKLLRLILNSFFFFFKPLKKTSTYG